MPLISTSFCPSINFPFLNPVLGANANDHHILGPISSWQTHSQWHCVTDPICCSLRVRPGAWFVPKLHRKASATADSPWADGADGADGQPHEHPKWAEASGKPG